MVQTLSRLFLLLPLLSGCLGVEVFYPEKEPIWLKPSTGNTLPEETCTTVMAQRGTPDHQSVDGDETTLVYRDGVAWAGIMPVIIVLPIPVALPVFLGSITYTCKDDALTSASRITTRSVGAICGLLDPIETGRWGCDVQ